MLQLSSTTITIFKWLGFGSAVLAIASLALTPWLLAQIPADYFKHHKPHLITRLRTETLGRCALTCLKNLLGLVLLILGIAMLVLPGQGALTILLSLYLIDFPHKKEIEGRLIRQPKVLKAVNWLRERRGRAKLEFDEL